jgi:hypothetical protein
MVLTDHWHNHDRLSGCRIEGTDLPDGHWKSQDASQTRINQDR